MTDAQAELKSFFLTVKSAGYEETPMGNNQSMWMTADYKSMRLSRLDMMGEEINSPTMKMSWWTESAEACTSGL